MHLAMRCWMFFDCIRCVWGDLVKLVNLQMAGLNEQQGYVLKLTSAEGYKEERVEVGGWEKKTFLFFLESILSLNFWDFSSSGFILDFHSTNTPTVYFTFNILFSHPETTWAVVNDGFQSTKSHPWWSHDFRRWRSWAPGIYSLWSVPMSASAPKPRSTVRACGQAMKPYKAWPKRIRIQRQSWKRRKMFLFLMLPQIRPCRNLLRQQMSKNFALAIACVYEALLFVKLLLVVQDVWCQWKARQKIAWWLNWTKEIGFLSKLLTWRSVRTFSDLNVWWQKQGKVSNAIYIYIMNPAPCIMDRDQTRAPFSLVGLCYD